MHLLQALLAAIAVSFFVGQPFSTPTPVPTPTPTAQPTSVLIDQFPSQINLWGYTWQVNSFSIATNTLPRNPGQFSGPRVYVDDLERLHLSITYRDGKWWSTEAVNAQDLGYGTYVFHLGSRVDLLDLSTVLAVFIWDRKPAESSLGEIDIEFSHWGKTTNHNSMYAVQPSYIPGNTEYFDLYPVSDRSTQTIVWTPTSIRFQSVEVFGTSQKTAKEVKSRVYTGKNIPSPDEMRAVISYWVNQAASVTGQSDFIIEKFEFFPLK